MKSLSIYFIITLFTLTFMSLPAQYNRLEESSTPPDNVIAIRWDGEEEKHIYTYNSNGSLTEDKMIVTGNENSSNWRIIYEYDENYNKTLELTQKQDSSGWVNYEKDEYEYDANNNELVKFSHRWKDSTWVIQFRKTFEYNSDGKPIIELREYWHLDQWNFDYQINSEYDENGYLSSQTEIVGSYEELVNYDRVTFVNDSEGNVLEQIEYYYPDDSWEPISRYLNSYNQDGLLDTTIFSFWEETFWDLISRTTYSYNSEGQKKEAIEQDFWDSVWVNWARENWIYNRSGKVEEYFVSDWISDTWEKDEGYIYEYDVEGNNTFQQAGVWENGAYRSEGILAVLSLKISDDLEFIYYGSSFTAFFPTTTTALNELDILPANFKMEQNYPNPFNPSTTIKYNIPVVALSLPGRQTGPVEGQHVQLKIYDILGNEVATLVDEAQAPGNYLIEFDASRLSSGVYIYSLVAGNFSSVKKMTLIK